MEIELTRAFAEVSGQSLLDRWEGRDPGTFWYFAQRAAEFQACLADMPKLEAEAWEEALTTAMGVTVEWLRGLAIVGCRVLEKNGPDIIVGIAFDDEGFDYMSEAQSESDAYWENTLIACADRLGPIYPIYPRLSMLYSRYLPLGGNNDRV